ncbi:hypothetical protein DBR42_20025 [Pelomonas sp. HMWF004]|nr:hypothetical protein DBR42_20025 [Pelomonas sp. HMWF004]
MHVAINIDPQTLQLIQRKAALLAQIQREKSPSGDVHPLCDEHDSITRQVQMRLGALVLESLESR